MTPLHKNLTAERWGRLTVCEQMANIGAEVGRAINWRNKGNETIARQASDRALELLDLSLDTVTGYPRLKEFARVRELVVDYFYGVNQYSSSDELWRKYFDPFNYAARRDR